jgi:hypothetical protein
MKTEEKKAMDNYSLLYDIAGKLSENHINAYKKIRELEGLVDILSRKLEIALEALRNIDDPPCDGIVIDSFAEVALDDIEKIDKEKE